MVSEPWLLVGFVPLFQRLARILFLAVRSHKARYPLQGLHCVYHKFFTTFLFERHVEDYKEVLTMLHKYRPRETGGFKAELNRYGLSQIAVYHT